MEFKNLSVGYLGSADQYYSMRFLAAIQKVGVCRVVFFSIQENDFTFPVKAKGILWDLTIQLKKVKTKIWYTFKVLHIRINCAISGIDFIKVNRLEELSTEKSFLVCDIIFTSGLRQKIESKIFNQIQYGVINFHYSLLPRYRGTFPLFWQAVNGDNEYGYTFHRIDEKIDQGEIIFQKNCAIQLPQKKYREIGELLESDACKHLMQVFENIENGLAISEGGSIYSNRDFIDYVRIDFKKIDEKEWIAKFKVNNKFILEENYLIYAELVEQKDLSRGVRRLGFSILISTGTMSFVIKKVNYLPAILYLGEIQSIWNIAHRQIR